MAAVAFGRTAGEAVAAPLLHNYYPTPRSLGPRAATQPAPARRARAAAVAHGSAALPPPVPPGCPLCKPTIHVKLARSRPPERRFRFLDRIVLVVNPFSNQRANHRVSHGQ